MSTHALKFSVNGHDYPQPLALLCFSATWCGPCQQMAPVLEQLAAKYPDALRVIKVDADLQQELAAEFAIRAVPTLALLGREAELDRQVGSASLPHLSQWVEEYFS